MKLRLVLFALTLAPTMAVAADSIPNGWIKAGNHSAEYEVGTDSSTHHGGRVSGCVKAVTKDLHGFGTLMQTAGPTVSRQASAAVGLRKVWTQDVTTDRRHTGRLGELNGDT